MSPVGRAYVNGGFRIIYNAHRITQGKNVGKYTCYYRKGSRYVKTIIDRFDNLEVKDPPSEKLAIK